MSILSVTFTADGVVDFNLHDKTTTTKKRRGGGREMINFYCCFSIFLPLLPVHVDDDVQTSLPLIPHEFFFFFVISSV